ncbi:hypothetical protein TWF481_006287 [Arthrobotrys musiformis]|uniref:Uncharacterized protein n=1 Tax=Arthrobotrys musiformis TaxID=47236 RepID=A0AAV9WI87_9PEZI
MRVHIRPTWAYILTAFAFILGNDSLARAHGAGNSWRRPPDLDQHSRNIISALKPAVGHARKPAKLIPESRTNEALSKIKRGLSDYESRGWRLIDRTDEKGDDLTSIVGPGDPTDKPAARYFEPSAQSADACPSWIQIFLFRFGMADALADEDNLYSYFVLTPKVPELDGSWAEFYVSVESKHLIVSWHGVGNGGRNKNFEADYSSLILALWLRVVDSTQRTGGLIGVPDYPLSHITVYGIKTPETIEILSDIQNQWPGNINNFGGFWIDVPSILDRKSSDARLWATLIGIPEIGAIEQMLSDRTTRNYFLERNKIKLVKSIRFSVEPGREGEGPQATILVTIGPSYSPGAPGNNQEGLGKLGDIFAGLSPNSPGYIQDHDPELVQASAKVILVETSIDLTSYPGKVIFEGSTLEPIEIDYPTGSKRKSESARTYRMSKWHLTTNSESFEHSEIRAFTSGPEAHLVLENSIQTEEKETLADFLYSCWIESQGSQGLRDITFLQLSPATESLIHKAYEEKKLDTSTGNILILWGRGPLRRAFSPGPDGEPSPEAILNDNLLRQFSETLEYGAVLKMILERERYTALPAGLEVRSLEIGDRERSKKSKGKEKGGKSSSSDFAILVRLGRAQDNAEATPLVSFQDVTKGATPPQFDEPNSYVEIQSISSSSPSVLEVFDTVASRREFSPDDERLEQQISDYLQGEGLGQLKNNLIIRVRQNDPINVPITEEPPPDLLLEEDSEESTKTMRKRAKPSTILFIERFADREKKAGKPNIHYLDVITRSQRSAQYRHLVVWIKASGPLPERFLGEFYVDLDAHHIVISRLPDLSQVKDLPDLSDILYYVILKLCQIDSNCKTPIIEFISIERPEPRTMQMLNNIAEVFNVDRDKSPIGISMIDSLLAEYATSWSQTLVKKEPSPRETILGVILRTREISLVQAMVVKYYKGRHLGDKILDEIFIGWEPQGRGKPNFEAPVPGRLTYTQPAEIFMVLRSMPGKLKRSDIVEWMAYIKSPPPRDQPDPKTKEDTSLRAAGPTAPSAVMIGQILIDRINQGISSGLGAREDQSGSGDATDLTSSATSPLRKLALSSNQKSHFTTDSRVDKGNQKNTLSLRELYTATLSTTIDDPENRFMLEYIKRYWHDRIPRVFIRPSSQNWAGTTVMDIPGYRIAVNEELRMMALVKMETREEVSLEQQRTELTQVYERSWVNDDGSDLRLLRALLLPRLTEASINVVERVLDFRKQSCKGEGASGRSVTIIRPMPPRDEPGAHFRVQTLDAQKSLEWATLIGMLEIWALVEAGLKRKTTKGTWFSPLAIVIICKLDDIRERAAPLLRVGVKLAHYSQVTGEEIDSLWVNDYTPKSYPWKNSRGRTQLRIENSY